MFKDENSIDLTNYLAFDEWNIVQASYLLSGKMPSDINNLLAGASEYKLATYIFEMAQASINNKVIQCRGKGVASSASPMSWLEWAISKEISLPSAFQEKYAAKLKAEKMSEKPISFSKEEHHKQAAVMAMKIIHDAFPDLPISDLITLKPVKEASNEASKKELHIWATQAGLKAEKVGRPSNAALKKFKLDIPEEWGYKQK